jgi:hypothetical protein
MNTKLISENIRFGRKERRFEVTPDPKAKYFTVQDIVDLNNTLKEEEKATGFKYFIRGLNVTRWNTFKSYDGDLEIEEYEDYYEGKVEDTTKFEKIFKLQIQLYETKKSGNK